MTIDSTTPISVTPNTLANTLNTGLLTDQTNLASLEEQISTGNAINAPSDNPAGAAQMLQLQASMTRANQYVTNANTGTGWLTLANSTASSILSQLQSVQSLVEGVSGSSLTGESSTLTTTADQVNSAMQNLINLANTTYAGGQPIFAGTGSSTEAYDSSGNYLGAGSAPTVTVAPGTTIPVSITGPEIFGSGSSSLLGSGGILDNIVNDLNGTNGRSMSDLGSDYTNLQSALNNAEAAAGTLGAQQDSVQSFATQASDSVSALEQQLGNVQSTNMAEAITSLQLQQTSYQEALYATSQLNTDSLAQYL